MEAGMGVRGEFLPADLSWFSLMRLEKRVLGVVSVGLGPWLVSPA